MSNLALNGGTPVRTKQFPPWPQWGPREVEKIAELVQRPDAGTIPGPMVQELGAGMAAAQDAKYCIPTSSGSAALQVALKATGLKPGDEVIMPAVSFVGVGAAPVHEGIVPVFVDIEPDTYNIDPDAAEAAISGRTRALMPVHFGGRPANLDRLLEIAGKHHLHLIEDAATAHGAKWRDKGVGSWGDIGVFSFQSSKPVPAGEGGCLVTDDQLLEQRCASLVNCGRPRAGDTLANPELGWNFRMSNFQAAVAVAQLGRLDEWTALKQENARYLSDQIAKIPGITPLRVDDRISRIAYFHYTFRYDSREFGGVSRIRFADALDAEGIIAYQSKSRRGLDATVYDDRLFRVDPSKYRTEPCPVSERAMAEEAVTIPARVLLGSRADIDDVAEAIRKIQANYQELASGSDGG